MAGHHHRHAVPVGRFDHLGVAHRAAGLDDRGHAGGRGLLDPVGEGKERRRRRARCRPGRVPCCRALWIARKTLSTRLIWPAPMPIAISSRASRMAFDLTEATAAQANRRSFHSCSVGLPLGGHFPFRVGRVELELVLHQEAAAHPLEVERPGAPAHRQLDDPELPSSPRTPPWPRRGTTARRPPRRTDRSCAWAVARSTTVLKATTEPKAETGSVARALRKASAAEAATAMPAGRGVLDDGAGRPVGPAGHRPHAPRRCRAGC